jgi:hypothetical protein
MGERGMIDPLRGCYVVGSQGEGFRIPGCHCAGFRSLVPDLDLARLVVVPRNFSGRVVDPQVRLRLQRSETSWWFGNILRSVSKDGQDALLAIAFGCFLITVSQFVLRLCNAFMNDQAVRAANMR